MPIVLHYLDSMMQTPVVSAAEIAPPEKLILYPNPASDEITLRLGEADLTRDVDIFDAGGRCVLARSVAGAAAVLDIHELPVGAFLVRATGTDGVRLGKLMIRR